MATQISSTLFTQNTQPKQENIFQELERFDAPPPQPKLAPNPRLGQALNSQILQRLTDLLSLMDPSDYAVLPKNLQKIASDLKNVIAYEQGFASESQALDRQVPRGLTPVLLAQLNLLGDKISSLAGVWGRLSREQRILGLNTLKTATQALVTALNPPNNTTQDQVKPEDMFTGVPSR